MDMSKEAKSSIDTYDMDSNKDLENVQSKALGEVLPYEQDKALLRKIDWRVVPIMFFCYFLQVGQPSFYLTHG
jgi:hypothetical protein